MTKPLSAIVAGLLSQAFCPVWSGRRLTAKWHWAGFLMTFPWLLYRKRFLDSIVYSVAGWSFIQLNVTIILVAIEYLLIRNLDEERFVCRYVLALGLRFGYFGRWWWHVGAMLIIIGWRAVKSPMHWNVSRGWGKTAGSYPQARRGKFGGFGAGVWFYAFSLFVIQVQFCRFMPNKKPMPRCLRCLIS